MAVSQSFSLGGTSPAAPGTVILTTQPNLDQFTEFIVQARLVGATGGTLDVYLQSSPNWAAAIPTWYDVCHFPQLAAGAAAVAFATSISRGYPPTASIFASNVADGTPSLAANTVLASLFGGAVRAVCVAGAGTTAGAVLVLNCIASEG